MIIEANNNIEETVTVKELAPGQLTITVMDQNDQAVSGAQVQLNEDQTETTNAEGQVVFDELVEGTYEYVINELPENYEHNIASQSVYIAEGATEARTLQVQHNVQPGTVIFNVTDQDNSPVEGAVISINTQRLQRMMKERQQFRILNPIRTLIQSQNYQKDISVMQVEK